MAMWTQQQNKVIYTRDKNILVSAAAGSGKTAVLVERIIQKILDEKNGINVDKLLVVTFTNAAASEMRERILRAIERELEKNPENEHLQKQQSYIHNASINTIHSFCLNLVREHFIDIDFDPGFKVADTNEIELLKGDVIKALLEEEYEVASPEFLQFANQFTVRNSDREIEKMILNLYEKAISYPWPDEWLNQSIQLYEVRNAKQLIQSNNYHVLTDYADELIRLAIMKCEYAIKLCMGINGPEKYNEVLQMDMQNLIYLLDEKDFDKRRILLEFQFGRLPRITNTVDIDEEKKTMVQDIRKDVKKAIIEVKKIYLVSMEKFIHELNQLQPIAKEYIRLTKKFMQQFQNRKRNKNILDFSDFEQFAIQILTRLEDGHLVPTKAAQEISETYEEVMIDEYQDSNMIQETILRVISKERVGIHNRFMVGDVKQSIYGFRGARPDIFIDKYNSYSLSKDNEEEAKSLDLKIILDKNFRSRHMVLGFINAIFRQTMSADFGGINYDEENQLNTGADYEIIGEESDYNTELIMINSEEETSQSLEEIPLPSKDTEAKDLVATDEMEAKVIAARIQELVDEKKGVKVLDNVTQEYRTAKYSDIVILLRSVNESAYAINDELTRQGIPSYMESKKGYFDTIEIRTILNYLKIIDNPKQDIPLASVLKSPVAGFDDEELAIIRTLSGKNKNLYDNLLEYEIQSESSEAQWLKKHDVTAYNTQLGKKVKNFLSVLAEFRDVVSYTSIYDLINLFLERTRYYEYVKAMPSGKRRCVNVDMLKAQAANYENGMYKGLFNFIRYIEKMQKFDLDMGEASILSESDNTVRIMTIHKSKGLEFPIVFLTNITKQFNMMDSKSKTVLHSELGIGMDYVNTKERYLHKNINKFLIARQMELDTVQEELRLLYVACTRAKEKLILTAKAVNRKKLEQVVMSRIYDSEVLPYAIRMKARSFFDMICPALCRNKAFAGIYDYLNIEKPVSHPIYNWEFYIDVSYVSPKEVFTDMIKTQYVKKANSQVLENLVTDYTGDVELRKKLIERLDFHYLYKNETKTNAKMSVSEIKKISYEIEEENQDAEVFIHAINTDVSTIPNFIKERKLFIGAQRGTVYHKVFELFDLSKEHNETSIRIMIDDLVLKGLMTKEERDCIKDIDFLRFSQSSLGKRMREAYMRGELYREAQFVLGLYESEVEEFKRIAQIMGKENKMEKPRQVEQLGDIVLIQGIIDVYFIEDDNIIIADYKTDNVKELSQLMNHYFVQLELYKRAVCQITGKNVSEKILYSVKFGEEVKL